MGGYTTPPTDQVHAHLWRQLEGFTPLIVPGVADVRNEGGAVRFPNFS